MKKYATIKAYCSETGFKPDTMRNLLRSEYGKEFSFRTGSGQNAPYTIIVPVFERMLEAGEFEEVLRA